MRPTLLIVEDDAALRDVLARSLRAEGFAASAVATRAASCSSGRWPSAPDALVIDIGLPDADGRDVCQALRAQGMNAPVLFLTARDALTDRLSGFSAGGDDYVTKPFDIEEVVARLHALLKRAAGRARRTSRADSSWIPHQHFGRERRTLADAHPDRVPPARRARRPPGKVLARQELIRAAWPHGAIVHDNTLDVYIARIRRKLARCPTPRRSRRVHGVGYRLG